MSWTFNSPIKYRLNNIEVTIERLDVPLVTEGEAAIRGSINLDVYVNGEHDHASVYCLWRDLDYYFDCAGVMNSFPGSLGEISESFISPHTTTMRMEVPPQSTM